MLWTIANNRVLDDVLAALGEGRDVYALEGDAAAGYHLVRADAWAPGRHTLGAYRQVEPFKSLLFRPREYLGELESPAVPGGERERIVFGVKNCDLASLAVQDHVFLHGGWQDPGYAHARERTIIVTSDCTGFREVCFCPVVGEQPFARAGFDVNIATTPQGCVIESGSARGEALLEAMDELLEPAGAALVAAREAARADMYDRLVRHQAQDAGLEPGMDLKRAIGSSFDSTLWQDFAADCVECGACNFTCCTCHCFLLADGVNARGEPARTKQWDACLFKGFARTAGGDPRPQRAERLRNRFDKKFVFFPEVLGTYACDGCGRCTEACIGKIDIRDVLKRAVDECGTVHADPGND
ncbi:MAG: 4Fe-4S dicluster domain-containing protein [Gammaproteobacteria bacterium]